MLRYVLLIFSVIMPWIHPHKTLFNRRFNLRSIGLVSRNYDTAIIALTREKGENRILRNQLQEIGTCHDLPCIEFSAGPDLDMLKRVNMSDYDGIVITSPRVIYCLLNHNSWANFCV